MTACFDGSLSLGCSRAQVDNHGGDNDFPHIDVSNVVLCYLTELWFTNDPCLREIVRAMVRKKPLIALLEPDMTEQHGGLSEAQCREILLSDKFAAKLEEVMGPQVAQWREVWDQPELQLPTGADIINALFIKRPALVWYRLADFQDVTMRLIAERLLSPCPPAGSAYRQIAYISGEITQKVLKAKLSLPAVRQDCSFHLYVSSNGPGDGVRDIAEGLKAFLPTLTWTTDLAMMPACEHMLVLLTAETWTRGEASDAFAREVCDAMREGVHRLLVHEVEGARLGDNEGRHATSFAQIIDATPPRIRAAKLYNEIAQNVGGAEWREAGLAKMAAQLCKGSGTREQWRVTVGSLDMEQPGTSAQNVSSSGSLLRATDMLLRSLGAMRAMVGHGASEGEGAVEDHGGTELLSRSGFQIVRGSRGSRGSKGSRSSKYSSKHSEA